MKGHENLEISENTTLLGHLLEKPRSVTIYLHYNYNTFHNRGFTRRDEITSCGFVIIITYSKGNVYLIK